MPADPWRRAESTRTVARSLAQAVAPLAFGGLAELITGIVVKQSPGTGTGLASQCAATGLHWTFLTMLGTLASAGVLLARARRTYPVDVATAAACKQAITR
jgi:succinate-acetate transporter protein